MKNAHLKLIRYPGGKQRLLNYLVDYLPTGEEIGGTFVEPFVGGGAVFFALTPQKALLADINPVLIDFYRGIRSNPVKIWKIFKRFPSTKEGYYKVRDGKESGDLAFRAARTLFLNRTCFKGMWRENSNGEFNVGYGGQDRRWVINLETLLLVSRYLKRAKLVKSDFEDVISSCTTGDFLFLDPPYRPGAKELRHAHYVFSKFSFVCHQRLAVSLKRATKNGVPWAMTISSHKEILNLYKGLRVARFAKGTRMHPGILSRRSGEVLICNY